MFGSWCPPCNAEAPDLGAFAEQNPDAQVVGIACEDTQDAAESASWTSTASPIRWSWTTGAMVQEFGITAYPTTIFYDAQGKEVDRLVGASTLDQFNASLAKAQ